MGLISCRSEKELSSKILYTNTDGETYEEEAVPNQAIIMFIDGITNSIQRQIIKESGGEILEYYPLLDSYLIQTDDKREMDFINKARTHYEVEEVHLNSISKPLSLNIHILDSFNSDFLDDKKNNVCLSHGDYCCYAATTAYPECPDCVIKVKHDFDEISSFFNPPLSSRNQKKFLNDIFEQCPINELILINMSWGRRLGSRERQLWSDSNERERKNWILGYIDDIKFLSNNLLKLSKYNQNFLVFKSAGNEGCHIMDEVIFNKIKNKLNKEQLRILNNHVLFVSAKDDDFDGMEKFPIDKTKLYAYYANSPSKYCPYMTMVDISHLSIPGTSFASPYLMGMATRLFDKEGYRPMNSDEGKGYNVVEMLDKIRNSTRDYAETIQQPGLYITEEPKQNYFFDKYYTFTGIVRSGLEDLCEPGVPENYLYLQIAPIDILVGDDPEIEESLYGVTQLQIIDFDLWDKIGKEVTLSGDLCFHFAGCHIHTDAFLKNIDINEDERNAYNISGNKTMEPETYYYNELQELKGTLSKKTEFKTDEFTGDVRQEIYYYLLLDSPIHIRDKNESSVPTLPFYKPIYNKTEVSLYGNYNPKEFPSGSRVKVQGRLTPEVTSSDNRGLNMMVENIIFDN